MPVIDPGSADEPVIVPSLLDVNIAKVRFGFVGTLAAMPPEACDSIRGG
jgi:hypothetical protein